ncbi:MAG: GGDEF domain-containing protein [Legionellaceae bacterium]|nr:GGDEF domain-containing protein [Legionellaceae bacterium]
MKELNRIDPQLKKKIINTISQYEEKCHHLQTELDVLRETIAQHNQIPSADHPDGDIHITALQTVLSGHPSAEVNSRLLILREMLRSLQSKTQDQQQQIQRFIRRATDLLKAADAQYVFSKPMSKLEKSLAEPANEKLLANQFLNVLQQYLQFCQQSLGDLCPDKRVERDGAEQTKRTAVFLGPMLNDSLRELLTSLSFPEQLGHKTSQLLAMLQQPLSDKRLVDVLDQVTELVVLAFNLEQNRLKLFLQDISKQLVDFESYLQISQSFGQNAREESQELAGGIDDQISQIQQHMHQCTDLADLIHCVEKGFKQIGERMQRFRAHEEQRIAAYAEQVETLQQNVVRAEQQVADIQEMLSYRELHMHLDRLTGMPNRAAYDEHLLHAWQRWQRGFGDLSLAIGDIDHFKTINDTYGHLAGDKVLKKIAHLFRSSIRAVDFVARYGGEEFVLVFERTPVDEAQKILEELRKLVQDTDFYYRNTKVDISLSFGVTMLKEDDDLEMLFDRADTALYKAKKSGRNRIEVL